MKNLAEFPAVYLHLGYCDMRLGMDRLSEKIKKELFVSVLSGGIFVFVSRSRTRVKLLYWDRDGYALWQKRLEAGVFRVEKKAEKKDGYEKILGVELGELLSGVDFSRIKLRQKVASGLYE